MLGVTTRMVYVTRICHNTSNWHFPTASAKAEKKSFFTQFGYGHEEWLFRSEWQLAGWQYGFLQGLNDKDKRLSLLKSGERVVDVVLFELVGKNLRRYVARVCHAEILDDTQAEDALQEYKKRGWYKLMLEEIDAVKGDRNAFGNVAWASKILNIRFRADDVEWYAPDTFVQRNDPTFGYRRYTFIHLSTDAHFPETINQRRTRAAQHTPPKTDSYFTTGSTRREVSPEHGKMQQVLFEELRKEYPNASVVYEENFVDVTVHTEAETIFYEIKSDLSTRRVIRLALGQLLEYAYYWDVKPERTIRLVAVGRTELTTDDERYLGYLTEKFNFPFEYRKVELPMEP